MPSRRRRPASARRQPFAPSFTASLFRRLHLLLVAAFALTVLAGSARAQCVSLTTAGSAYTQNFNTLSNTAGSTTNNLTITGWFLTETGGGARDNEQYAVDTGGSSTGDTYSYGAAGNTDRALGGLQSGTLIPVIGACFTNNTGAALSSLDIAYTGEQWRIGNTAAARDDRLDFQYSLDATSLATGTWTDVNALDFTNPIKTAATAGALDGNAAANRTAASSSISSLSIANGATFWIRWNDLNASGADDGLAVDDFSLTPQGAGGGGVTLSINDVSQNEGNAGTTSYTFTVSLSSTTHGGVTFDIATADGTAQDDNPATEDNDYVAKSLTNQTISNGSNSYSFTVDVNGDTTPEPNETFFVNVTNVTGATVTDGQGQGTITNDDVTLTPIHTIQGNGSLSPLNGASVTTSGIVTGLRSNGFFLQDPAPDADTETSEGIFVFTSSAPPAAAAIGNSVQVTGTVQEFSPPSDPVQRPLTELSGTITVNLISTGNSLPTPITLTPGETTAPSETGNPLETLEEYEGMRVTIPSLTVVAPTDGTINEPNATVTGTDIFFGVVTGVARPFREPGINLSDPVPAPNPPNVPRFDENPERIRIDSDGQPGAAQINVTAGTILTNVTGPLDYAFRSWAISPDAATPPTVGTLGTAIPVPVPAADELTVASFNMQRFFDTVDDPGGDPVLTTTAFNNRLNKASLNIRNVMRTPDVVGVIEMEHLSTLQAVATKINNDAVAAGDPNPNYQAYLVEGNDIGGIDVGFLVKASRVTVVDVTQIELAGCDHVTASTCYNYTNPNNGALDILNDRPPLVLRATAPRPLGGTFAFTVIVNHLRSLNGVDDATVDGTGTVGARVREKRRKQAEFLANYIQGRQTADPAERIISVGDYNAFQFNDGYVDVMGTIMGTPAPADQVVLPSADLVNPNLIDLINTLPPDQRYSYTFDGNAQALDHVLVNDDVLALVNRFAYGRTDADFPVAYYADGSRPERISDHDPGVAYISLGTPQPAGSVIISEYRLRGPNPVMVVSPGVNRSWGTRGASAKAILNDPRPTALPSMLPEDNDEFIEFYNNTDSPITVSTVDGSAGWSLVASDGVARFTIPNGTVIPARGHYLAANSLGYSLTNYPGGHDGLGETFAQPDLQYSLDIPDQSGLALFNTALAGNFNEAHRLDAVGYASSPALYREGLGFSTAAPGADVGGNAEWSFVRDLVSGTPKDTGDNNADFIPVETSGQALSIGRRLGAPGPENSFAPIRRLNVLVNRLDSAVGQNSPPNRVRNLTAVTNGANGTLSIRRTVVNATGAPVTRLRFRIIQITTFPSPTAGVADVRALTSGDIMVTLSTGGAPVPVQGTVLEEPPLQPNGGGWNTSWTPAGTINFESPLPAGASVNVQFLLGVQQTGTFSIFINVEALP